jgi:hypothetical protein
MAMPLTAPSKTNAERQQAASLDLFLVTDVRPSSHETVSRFRGGFTEPAGATFF